MTSYRKAMASLHPYSERYATEERNAVNELDVPTARPKTQGDHRKEIERIGNDPERWCDWLSATCARYGLKREASAMQVATTWLRASLHGRVYALEIPHDYAQADLVIREAAMRARGHAIIELVNMEWTLEPIDESGLQACERAAVRLMQEFGRLYK